MKLRKLFTASLCMLLCVAMLLSFAGCGSTPAVAITVDGKDYATGEYLAYLLDTFQQAYYNGGLYYYAQNGTDVWGQDFTHDDKQVKLDEYVKLTAVDTIIRQKALENKIAEEGVKLTEESGKNAQQMVDAADEAILLSYGISKENYAKMCQAYYRNELSLFLAHYGKDGTKAVAEKDIRAHFEENYISYKMISVPLTDSEGKELSEADQKTETAKLQKYLDMYQAGTDFNRVIAQYNYDTTTGDDKKLEELTDSDTRKDGDATTAGDEELVKAVKSVPVGTAKLVTYSAGGSTKTAAVILRIDPESGKGYENYYEDNRQNILLALKFDEFDEEINNYAKTLKYTLNDRAYKMCDPKDFVG